MASEIQTENSQSYFGFAEAGVKRLALWLAVGNGVALAAVGSKILDSEGPGDAHLLIVSAWAFFAGLGTAFTLHFVLVLFHRAMARWWEASESSDEEITVDREVIRLNRVLLTVFFASVAAFAFGLLYPLVAFSFRLSG